VSTPLRLPALRQPGAQLPIWDWVGNVTFTSWAQTRHATGQFAEELVLKLLGGEAMVTDGQADICPDIRLDARTYLECKSVGRGKNGILYEHILDRGVRFVRRNKVKLFYVFCIHSLGRAGDSADLFALRRRMATSIDRLIIVPFSEVVEYTKTARLQKMNYRSASRTGKLNEPMPGWKISAAALRKWSSGQPTFAFDTLVYGCPTGGFPIYGALPCR